MERSTSANTNSNLDNGPPLPRGQMPIEEVFRMMWTRMNYLENIVKEQKELLTGEKTDQHLSVSDLKMRQNLQNEQNQENVQNQENLDNGVKQLNEIVEKQNERITEVVEKLDDIKQHINARLKEVDTTFQTISSDITEMNTKYAQMNNFLLDIQTTQITVNNQILRHYNDNFNEDVESQIEKNVAQRMLDKNIISAEVVDSESVSQVVQDVEGAEVVDTESAEVPDTESVAQDAQVAEVAQDAEHSESAVPNKGRKTMKITDNENGAANVTFNIQ